MNVVIGNTTVDVVVAQDREPVTTVGDGFTRETVQLLEHAIEARLGGNGANSAASLAVLGREVALASGVGEDAWADLIVGWLRSLDVGVDLLVRSGTSGVSILDTLEHDRHTVVHAPWSAGATDLPVDPEVLLAAEAVLLTGPSLVPDAWCAALSQAARTGQRSGLWVVDVGPALGPSDDGAGTGELLELFDLVIGNERELCGLGRSPDPRLAASRIHDRTSRPVILKQGARGATIVDGGARPVPVPGTAVKPRTAAGAGDAFDAALLSALHEGADLDEAVEQAHAFAAMVLSTPGGVVGLHGDAERPPPWMRTVQDGRSPNVAPREGDDDQDRARRRATR